MPFSAYDSGALRLLSATLFEAMETLRLSAGRALTQVEAADFSKLITANLTKVYDQGERGSEALARAALEGVVWTPAKK